MTAYVWCLEGMCRYTIFSRQTAPLGTALSHIPSRGSLGEKIWPMSANRVNWCCQVIGGNYISRKVTPQNLGTGKSVMRIGWVIRPLSENTTYAAFAHGCGEYMHTFTCTLRNRRKTEWWPDLVMLSPTFLKLPIFSYSGRITRFTPGGVGGGGGGIPSLGHSHVCRLEG